MKLRLKNIIIYLFVIAANIGISFLLNLLLFKNNLNYFFMTSCGFILLVTLAVFIISGKLGYKLDMFVYEYDDTKFYILNSIFIANLFSIPLSVFISMLF